MTPEQEQSIRGRHTPAQRRPEAETDARGDLVHDADLTLVCQSDRRKWPCDTAVVMAALDACDDERIRWREAARRVTESAEAAIARENALAEALRWAQDKLRDDWSVSDLAPGYAALRQHEEATR